MQPKSDKSKFELNKADINKLGFDLSSSDKVYTNLISPFEDDIDQAHPLCCSILDGFNSVQFQIENVAQRLPDQTLYYIFYNVMDQRLQLSAARMLIDRNMKYHKTKKVWVGMQQKQFKYWSISQWKLVEFSGDTNEEEFYLKQDFMQR